jgi:hypothetical protein
MIKNAYTIKQEKESTMSKISISDKTLTIDYVENEEEVNKTWHTKLDICQSPTCRCRELTIELYNTEKTETEEPEFRVSFNVFENKAVKLENKKSSKEDFELSELIAHHFSKENWEHLQKRFLEYKRASIKTTPIDQLQYSFPMKKIERDGLMIGYYDVFPYAEELWLERNNTRYLLDDQYCLASTCSCTHTMLTIIAVHNDLQSLDRSPLVLKYDYKTNSIGIVSRGPGNIATPNELLQEMRRNGFIKIFIKRHKQLRLIYNHYRKKKSKTLKRFSKKYSLSGTEKKENLKKIGRNAPCPCGSGKKYKNCCQ